MIVSGRTIHRPASYRDKTLPGMGTARNKAVCRTVSPDSLEADHAPDDRCVLPGSVALPCSPEDLRAPRPTVRATRKAAS